jgi:hypothetical protein
LTSRARGIISAERLLGLSLEIHEVGVQPLLRGGEMLEQDAALPVETNASTTMPVRNPRPVR